VAASRAVPRCPSAGAQLPHCGTGGSARSRLLIGLLLALALWPGGGPPPSPAAVPGELLVLLQPGAPPLPAQPLGPAAPVYADAPATALPVQRVRVPPGAEAPYAAALRELAGVRHVERNGRVMAAGQPNDPYYGEYQWNLRQIHAPEAWDLTVGSRQVIIAIVDTGIALDHPDLVDKLVPGLNLVTPGAPPNDDNGHGTHVAGIAAAATNNALGIAGVDWEARLMPVKVLDQAGGGDVNRVAQGIVWAVDNGARVINLSFTGSEPSAVLAEAVRHAREKGALVVAAVGNEGRAAATYPAALEGVLAVAATDRNDQRLPFSNTGDYVAVAAPGLQVPSTFWDPTVGNTYALASTTSQAAPHVAGLAGLIWAVNPDLRSEAVRALIENHADDVGPPGRDPETGAGRINAYRSVLAALPWNYASSGALAYRAPVETAQRVFLPYVVKAYQGWTSTLVVRNPTPQPVTLTVTFVGAGGTAVTAVGAGLNPYGSTTLPLHRLPEVPAGFEGGAVVEADGRLAVLVYQDRAGGNRHGYVGIGGGAARLYAPLVMKAARAGSTTLYLQNLGDSQETATVSYLSAAGAPQGQQTVALAPRATAAVRLAEAPFLPEGFVGAALVESANGTPLAAVSALLGPQGEATSYTLPAEVNTSLAAPLVFKNARRWSTGIQVFNAGQAPAQVTAAFLRPDRAAAVQETATIPPRGSATLYQPANAALPDDYVGSAVLSSTGGPLVAVVNQVRAESNLAMAYTAAPGGATTLDLPLLTKDYGGWTSGVRIQNLAAEPADLAIVYYDQAGRPVHTTQDTLPPGGSTTYVLSDLAALPWGFQGAATVASNGRPLAAVVNQLKLAP